MDKVTVKLDGVFQEVELLEWRNKGYDQDDNGDLVITNFSLVVKLPNGVEAVLDNPELGD